MTRTRAYLVTILSHVKARQKRTTSKSGSGPWAKSGTTHKFSYCAGIKKMIANRNIGERKRAV